MLQQPPVHRATRCWAAVPLAHGGARPRNDLRYGCCRCCGAVPVAIIVTPPHPPSTFPRPAAHGRTRVLLRCPGRKRWLISKGVPSVGVNPKAGVKSWLRHHYPLLLALHGGELPDTFHDCTLGPGDVMYLPAGWYVRGCVARVCALCRRSTAGRWRDRCDPSTTHSRSTQVPCNVEHRRGCVSDVPVHAHTRPP